MIDAYIALMIFIVFMVATPGPANMVLMIGGAQKGVRACFGFIIGVVCGKLLLNLLFGFGFGLHWLQHCCKPIHPAVSVSFLRYSTFSLNPQVTNMMTTLYLK